MICAAGKANQEGRVGILIIGLTPRDLEWLSKGRSQQHPFGAIDPSLGEGVLLVVPIKSQEEFLSELEKRFEIGRVCRVDHE